MSGDIQLFPTMYQIFLMRSGNPCFPKRGGIHTRAVARSFFNASSSSFGKLQRLGRRERSCRCRRDRYLIVARPLVGGAFDFLFQPAENKRQQPLSCLAGGTSSVARTGPSSNFHAMSDEEVESPRGAAADTEPEDVSGEEMECATKIRFRTKSTWKQINHFSVDGKSETDISILIFESAKEQLQPWLPPLMDE